MDPIVFNEPCLLFAMRREAQRFYQEFRPQQRFSGAPCRARFCGPEWLTVLVLETGMGTVATEAALGWALSKPMLGNVAYRPKCVISAGFAGALREEQRVGDIILATEVRTASGESWPTTWPGELPPGEWQPALHRGRLVCADQLIGARNNAGWVEHEARRWHGVGRHRGSVTSKASCLLCPHSMPCTHRRRRAGGLLLGGACRPPGGVRFVAPHRRRTVGTGAARASPPSN